MLQQEQKHNINYIVSAKNVLYMYVIYANVYTPTHARIFKHKNKNMHNKLKNKRKTVWIWNRKRNANAEWQHQHLMSFLVLY